MFKNCGCNNCGNDCNCGGFGFGGGNCCFIIVIILILCCCC